VEIDRGAIITSIVTVHGTFANHKKDEGEKWWQKGSTFQEEVAARIDTEAADINWVPFHWSGKNSEADRRRDGVELFKFLHENFESKNQPYHLVGHSHGGSVIAEALRWSTRQNSKLENMQSWITVATPFLAFKKQKRLFSRVKRRYQLLLAIMTAYVLAVLLSIPFGMCSDKVGENNECWVEKSASEYFDFVDINNVKLDLRSTDVNDLPLPRPIFNRGNTEQDVRIDRNGEFIPVTYDKKHQSKPKTITSFKKEGGEIPTTDGSGEITIWPNSTCFIDTLRDTDLNKGDCLGQDINLTKSFNNLANIEFDETGSVPLNMCAKDNLALFSLDTPTYAKILNPRGVPRTVNNQPRRVVIKDPYVQETSNVNTAHLNIRVEKRFLEPFKEQCRSLNDDSRKLKKETIDWGKTVGFKAPVALTYLVNYKNGKRRLLQFQFQYMDQINITPFITRSEALKSLGMLLYLAITSIPVLIAAYFLWKSQKFLLKRYKHQDDDRFTNWYKSNWLKLAHPEDEAINAISASTKVKVNMAPADMLQGVFMMAFSTIVALLLIFNGVKWINWILPDKFSDILGFKRELVKEFGYAINSAQDVMNGTDAIAADLPGIRGEIPFTFFFNDDGGLSILALLVVFGLILLGFIYIGRMLEKHVLNPMLKRVIDGIAQGSGVSGAFGDDVLGENAKICLSHPVEFEDPHTGEFPETVQQAIEKYANEDLVNLPSKFRAALHKNVTSAHDFDISDLLEGEMGEILLHTSYFNVKEFHDLFAAALVATGDYKAGPKFKSRTKAATWIKGLKA
jgi:hypothetical protein